jgi:hypothetical protein
VWIFTSTGFVSVVQHRDDPARLVVRARDRVSLEPLVARTGAEVDPWRGTDYAHRIVVGREPFEAWLVDAARAIDYPNYKASARRARGGRFERSLHRVWEVMSEFQDAGRTGVDAPG